MTEHKFGGTWTEIKLSRLQKYLGFYTQALKNAHQHYGWSLSYIDAFAGTGECVVQGRELPIAGSAKIALETKPAFDQYIFIDERSEHVDALQLLSTSYPDKNIKIYNEDANSRIIKICESIDWKKNRAVIFLDPYGMEVKWDTLECVAKTQAIDVWYLFPLSGLYRQAARKYTSVSDDKAKAIDELLGTSEWRTAFYEAPAQSDLFDSDPSAERTMQWDDLLKYVREERLKSIFAEVSNPMILPNSGVPRFALFFAVSNPGPAAVGLSMKVANHILKSE